MKITESYRTVQYDLRPAKQVERRMLVDAFQRLTIAGFPIPDYQYTGMGSIYFVDFAIFHRYLGLKRMWSVEISRKIAKRVQFNKPFGDIEIYMEPIGNVLPRLSRDRKHLVWLDYDDVIQGSYTQDVVSAATIMPPGSILLITVDADPPGPPKAGPAELSQYFHREVGDYLPRNIRAGAFAKQRLPALNVEVLSRAIQLGLRGRTDLEFMPLFNFLYADGHRMITMGGMICGNDDKRRLQGAGLESTTFYRCSFDLPPCNISVPRFTKKERLYLDGHMPCDDDWLPSHFEAESEDILAYRDLYRFLPSYAELLL